MTRADWDPLGGTLRADVQVGFERGQGMSLTIKKRQRDDRTPQGPIPQPIVRGSKPNFGGSCVSRARERERPIPPNFRGPKVAQCLEARSPLCISRIPLWPSAQTATSPGSHQPSCRAPLPRKAKTQIAGPCTGSRSHASSLQAMLSHMTPDLRHRPVIHPPSRLHCGLH